MIHEVMVLDNSGIDLAFITWGAAIKMFLIASLITVLVVPCSFPIWSSLIIFAAIISLISIVIGTIESLIARFRMTHVFEFIFIMSILALLVLTLVTYRIYGN